MLARADVFCLEEGGLGFKGLEVMVLVGNLDRSEAHIVGSHEKGNTLLLPFVWVECRY